MAETLGAVGGAILFVGFVVFSIRRRARMTPDERYRDDMLREQRKIRRELERQKYD